MAQCIPRRVDQRGPFADPEPLLRVLALRDDARIQADAGIVEEDPVVDLADIDGDRMIAAR